MKAKSFEDLPKWIEYDTVGKTLFYHPTIIKWENENLPNAYFAMYARFYPALGHLNPEQVLFSVCSGSLNDVIEKFIAEYNEMSKFIKNRKWIGERPQKISLRNMSVDGYVLAKNVNKPKL